MQLYSFPFPSRFFKELEDRHQQNIVIDDISDIVTRHAQSNFDPYVTYCSNEVYQQRTLQRLLWVQHTYTNSVTALTKSHLSFLPFCLADLKLFLVREFIKFIQSLFLPQSKNKKSNCEIRGIKLKTSHIARNEIKWQLQYHIVRYKDRSMRNYIAAYITAAMYAIVI